MAPKEKRKHSQGERFAALADQLSMLVPSLYAVLIEEDDFIGLNIKVMADGTCLAVLKAYGSDGTPMVCFGSGYGYVGCLLTIDSTVQGGRWRQDKPWAPSKDGK